MTWIRSLQCELQTQIEAPREEHSAVCCVLRIFVACVPRRVPHSVFHPSSRSSLGSIQSVCLCVCVCYLDKLIVASVVLRGGGGLAAAAHSLTHSLVLRGVVVDEKKKKKDKHFLFPTRSIL